MKGFIQRVNQYFLERFPLLWNTRFYWMAAAGLTVHAIFYLMGYFAFTRPGLLNSYSVNRSVEANGIYLFSIIVSVLMLVGWLLVLLRNNAFKNFYPTGAFRLFCSFLIYLLIFFLCVTFFISYIYGGKRAVEHKYPADWVEKTREKANLAAAFLVFTPEPYSLKNKRFPAPFDTLYCETDRNKFSFFQPYISGSVEDYQYYTVKRLELGIDRPGSSTPYEVYRGEAVDERRLDSTIEIWVKDKVVDLSLLADTTLSIYNYSFNYFNNLYYDDYAADDWSVYDKSQLQLNRQVYELLERNNPSEIKALLQWFLNVSGSLAIKTNLTADKWFDLIYHPGRFEVSKFISNQGFEPEMSPPAVAGPAVQGADEVAMVTLPAEPGDSWSTRLAANKTSFYFDGIEMKRTLSNIKASKEYSVFSDVFYVVLWIAFALAAILFAFRVTNLRLLLFAGITAGVLAILIALIVVTLRLGGGNYEMLFVCYLVLAVASVILFTPIIALRKLKKNLQGIFINITIVGFVLYCLLILVTIATHQKIAYSNLKNQYDNYYNTPTILQWLGLHWNYVLFGAGLLFLMAYCVLLRRWRALPASR